MHRKERIAEDKACWEQLCIIRICRDSRHSPDLLIACPLGERDRDMCAGREAKRIDPVRIDTELCGVGLEIA